MTAQFDDYIKHGKERMPDYLILLSAPVLLTIYYYHGFSGSFLSFFPAFHDDPLLDFYKVIYQFASFFLLFFILPFSFNQFYLKRPLAELGLGFGDFRMGLRLAVLMIALVVLPASYLSSKMTDVHMVYPMAKILHNRHDLILAYDLFYLFLYYVAWEFYFRGFLLFGTRKTLGDSMAIVIQTIPSCLIHLGKPEGETIGSIFAGIILGVIAIRTQSIWYVFLMHASMGILTDLFIIYN